MVPILSYRAMARHHRMMAERSDNRFIAGQHLASAEQWEAMARNAYKTDAIHGREHHQTSLLRTVKLIADGSEHLCILRRMSGTGVLLQFFHAMPRARSYALETANGIRYPIEPDGSEGGTVKGFQFLKHESIRFFADDLITHQERHDVRLQSAMTGTLRAADRSFDIVFFNLSQQGACIECNGKLLLSELVRIETAVLPTIFAKVRWRERPRYGLIFEQTLRYDELARRLAPELCSERPSAGG